MATLARPTFTQALTAALAVSSLFALAGCGKTGFKVTSNQSCSSAAGTFQIPPKVDILLAEDDTGSATESFRPVSSQLVTFFNGLQSQGWDYHFATIPLTNKTRPVTQVVASQYDPNWGSAWIPPFPGADISQIMGVSPTYFTTPDRYTGLLSSNELSNDASGVESGFDSIVDGLYNRLPSTTFMRRDALLAVLVVSNGNDTSGYNLVNRGDGILVPDPANPYRTDCVRHVDGARVPCDLNYYLGEIQATKPVPSLAKLYAAVASQSRTNCLLSPRAFAGSRYMQAATMLTGGAASFDICSQSISSALSSMQTNLVAQVGTFRQRYVFIDQDADPSSITVVKKTNCKDVGVVLPNNATNGWTYAGLVQNVYAIDDPIQMNLASGYAIELHGTAKLVGAERADISYKPAGNRDTPPPR